MNKKTICLLIAVVLFLGSAAGVRQAQCASADRSYDNKMTIGGEDALVFDPLGADQAALPDMRDLPVPAKLTRQGQVRQYTGIIKNKTRYDVSVPSGNSGATLVIPARGFIEYISWKKNFDLTVYQDGKPFYCLKINAHPKEYAYMCQKYDFLAEIVKPEPRTGPSKRKKRIRKQVG
jgi:hypothetical protein